MTHFRIALQPVWCTIITHSVRLRSCCVLGTHQYDNPYPSLHSILANILHIGVTKRSLPRIVALFQTVAIKL